MSQLKVGHVGLNVSNLERSIAFYKEIFGFTVRGESQEDGRKYVFLGTDDAVITLWQQSEGSFSNSTPGLHHLAFQVSSIEDVKSFESKLKDRNAKFIYDSIVTHREGSQSGGIFFEDPDGIRLEIFTATGAHAHGKAGSSNGPSCGFF